MARTLDPIILTAGQTFKQQLDNPIQILALKITNKGIYDVQYSGFGVSGDIWLPAGTEWLFHHNGQNAGSIDLTAQNTGNVSPAPQAALLVTEYYSDEEIPKGTWPVSIPQSTVSANVSNVTTLTNTGNPTTLVVIKIQPSDAGSPVFQVDNAGNLILSGDNAGILTTFLQAVAGASPSLKLAAATLLTEILGNLKVDGTTELANTLTIDAGGATITGTVSVLAGSIGASSSVTANGGGSGFDGSNNVFAQTINSQNKTFQFNGVTILVGNANANDTFVKAQTSIGGVHMQTGTGLGIGFHAPDGTLTLENGSSALGKLKFADGSTMAEIHGFTGTGTGTFNHNCTKQPNNIQLTAHFNGSQTMGYDSEGASTVHVTSGAGGAWTGIAFVYN